MSDRWRKRVQNCTELENIQTTSLLLYSTKFYKPYFRNWKNIFEKYQQRWGKTLSICICEDEAPLRGFALYAAKMNTFIYLIWIF